MELSSLKCLKTERKSVAEVFKYLQSDWPCCPRTPPAKDLYF